jgi:hypothetical protein
VPFTLLSHQAPVLPLKLLRPRWFCATALAIGSMAPDLEYVFVASPSRQIGHTLVGQLTFCLPLTLILVWLVRLVVARPVALHLPDLGPFHLRDYRLLGRARPTFLDAARVTSSALIGSLSHLLLDGLSHGDGFIVERVRLLRAVVHLFGRPVPIYRLLQHGGSLVLALFTLWFLAYMGRRRLIRRWAGDDAAGMVRPPLASYARLWTPVALFALAGAGLRLVEWWNLGIWRGPTIVGHLVFQAACFAFLGACVGSLLARRVPTPRDS